MESLGNSDNLVASELEEPYLCLQAKGMLANHPHLRSSMRRIAIEKAGPCLVITGRVPTFYLKQLAQEALRPLNTQIVNNMHVG